MASLTASSLTQYVAAILEKHGASSSNAMIIAHALVTADIEGTPSHGVMLVPMYAERIRAGSVSVDGHCPVIRDEGNSFTMDARNNAGQLSSRQAVERILSRAPQHSLVSAAVRNGFHFGTASYWALQMAEAGLIGIAMSNTRPLMPAPGGAQAVVGNNPLAIAAPTADGPPICLDMATSASAMGKIRMAAQKGDPIPEGWATDKEGVPTTSATDAIKGMLLPAAGPKGFGLALMIDIMCGALSGGGTGRDVQPLYGDAATPYNCAHFFLAINPAHFVDPALFRSSTRALVDQIHQSTPAPGVARLYVPGELRREAAGQSRDACRVTDETLMTLAKVAHSVGIDQHPESLTFP